MDSHPSEILKKALELVIYPKLLSEGYYYVTDCIEDIRIDDINQYFKNRIIYSDDISKNNKLKIGNTKEN